jgi:hypothetical protein
MFRMMAFVHRTARGNRRCVLIVTVALCLVACSAYDAKLLLPATPPDAGAMETQDGGAEDAGDTSASDAGDAGPMLDDASRDAGDACAAGSGDCCADDPFKAVPGACGCGVSDVDSDSDGTSNCHDECPNDPGKVSAGVCGCGIADTDSDSDAVLNCMDGCPNDPAKNRAGVCGCGVVDTFSDSDSTPDCKDGCPSDSAKAAPGICGCGVADTDSDADGTPDCHDGCAKDAAKTSPGVCGCGAADTDSDSDGTLNCSDGCPNDSAKNSGGACGCGVADTDSDADGTANCNDGCPADSNKTAAGACGCGFPDVSDGCLGLRSALAHRYSFNGTGTTVSDAKGGSSGTVKNAQLSGNGSVALSGSSQYVDMPTNMLSSLTNATLEAWVVWSGSGAWQRVFDCGNSRFNSGESYLFLATSVGSGGMRTAYSTNGRNNEISATAPGDLPMSSMRHVAVVVDDAGNALSLYEDGVQVDSATFAGHLSSITYSSCWLGRSLFNNDPYFDGTFYELRVYDAALTAGQLLTSFRAGPDATFF